MCLVGHAAHNQPTTILGKDTGVTLTAPHVDALITELQQAWHQPGAGRPEWSQTRQFRPIAGSPEDQTTPGGIQNPLWDIVRWMPAEPPWFDGGRLMPELYPTSLGDLKRFDTLGLTRGQLATRYTWSIITPGDVDWMVVQLDGRGVVEIGAGSGYWAWQLEQAGVSVAAYDPYEPGGSNEFCKHGPYTTVLPEGPEAVAQHPDRALLMVWPPYEGNHAAHALSVYRGDLLLYAGEAWGGCTADDGFYELLDAEWTEVSESPAHVTWSGIHCSLKAYRRII